MSKLYVNEIVEATAGAGVHIPGSAVQSVVWKLSPVEVSTGGSWGSAITPTLANTYQVESYTFTKKFSSSKVILSAQGHVDMSGVGSGVPSIVALFLDSPETLLAAGYRHVRNNIDEPFVYAFNGEDTTTGISKTYRIRCNSTGGPMRFSRMASGGGTSYGNVPFNIIITEIAQ